MQILFIAETCALFVNMMCFMYNLKETYEMTIVVCDDDISETQHIAELINSYNSQIRLITHTNPLDTIAFLNAHPAVDLCILDIIMPEISGVELARELRDGAYTGEIIFLTSSNNYAFESYEVKAFRYVLKPCTSEKLSKVLYEVEEKKTAEDNTGIMIKTQDETRFVRIAKLCMLKHS